LARRKREISPLKKCCIFAASSPKTLLLIYVGVAFFIVTNTTLYAAKYRLSNPYRFAALHKSVNVFGETGGDSLSSVLNINDFHSVMPKTMKTQSDAKDSNIALTPTERNTVNLLNLQPQNQQGIGNVEGSDVVGNNQRDSTAIGRDANNSDIGHTTTGDGSSVSGDISKQDNHVQDNHGITGITGTGHTINVYQYPKELTELLTRLVAKL
jgi:hypothetical protein